MYNPFGMGYPPWMMMNNAPQEDDIDKLEKTLRVMKRIRDEARDEVKREDEGKKKPDDKKTISFDRTETFMMLMACSSLVQTILVWMLIRGR